MVDRLVIQSFMLVFKLATPEKVMVIVLFNKTCYLIFVVSFLSKMSHF